VKGSARTFSRVLEEFFVLLKDALIAIGLALIAFGAFRLIDFLGLVLKAP
jgi:hypothetical protein